MADTEEPPKYLITPPHFNLDPSYFDPTPEDWAFLRSTVSSDDEEIKKHMHDKEVSVASHLALTEAYASKMPVCDTGLFAIDHAQTRSKKAYDVTGVVAVQCNHGLVRKNGVANLRKGER